MSDVTIFAGGRSVQVPPGAALPAFGPQGHVTVFDGGNNVQVLPAPSSLPAVGKIHAFPVNLSRLMCSQYEYPGGSQYFRYDTALLVFADTFALSLLWSNLNSGGGRLLPLHPQYGVRVALWDDFETQEFAAPSVEVGRYLRTNLEATANGGKFTSASLSAAGLVPGKDYVGWYVAYNGTASGAVTTPILDNPLPFYFHYNPAKNPALQTHILFGDGSYDWTHGSNGYHIARVPIALNTRRAYPRRTRIAPQSASLPVAGNLYLSYTSPMHVDGLSRPSRTKDGFLVSAAKQGYFRNQMRNPYFQGALVDGPRGKNCGGFGMGLRIGRNGGKYVMDGCGTAFVRYLPDDTRITIAGWRDDEPIYYPDVKGHPSRTLVGDWSAIPDLPGRRQFNNVWGWCWDARTTTPGASTNPQIGGEPVHDGDVVSYFVDRCAEGGRMLEVRERGDDPNRGTPSQAVAKIREVLLPGSINDGFDLEWWTERGLMLCAERKAHGLSMILPPPLTPKGTPATAMCTKAGWYIQNPNGSSLCGFADDSLPAKQWDVEYDRTFVRKGTLAQCQAAPILGPECIEIKDGVPYWSSGAQQDIRRSADGVAIQRCAEFMPGSTKFDFLRFAIADGSFMPDGMIAACSFDNSSPSFTRPRLFKPTPTGVFSHTQVNGWNLNDPAIVSGRGANGWNQGAYPMDPAFSKMSQSKSMLCWTDTADSGPAEVTLVQADDPPVADEAQMAAGRTKYEAAGLRGIYGDGTHGFINADLVSTDSDIVYYRDQIAAAE